MTGMILTAKIMSELIRLENQRDSFARLINARFSTGLKFAGKRKTPYSEIDNISEIDTTNSNDRIDGANLPGLIDGISSESKTTSPLDLGQPVHLLVLHTIMRTK